MNLVKTTKLGSVSAQSTAECMLTDASNASYSATVLNSASIQPGILHLAKIYALITHSITVVLQKQIFLDLGYVILSIHRGMRPANGATRNFPLDHQKTVVLLDDLWDFVYVPLIWIWYTLQNTVQHRLVYSLIWSIWRTYYTCHCRRLTAGRRAASQLTKLLNSELV